ncbi:MAG: ATP-dependent DNA helicase [Lachnospiraceae bacterium]|nr:ATP-dependent DNA helicase [Lachnospiraceae bacterium]
MADEIIKDEISISVRGLVEFILRSGDIDNTGAGPAGTDVMLQGSRVHRKIQNSRGVGYEAEVPLKVRIPYEKYDILIEGRADGIFTDPETAEVTVEEIKGTYRKIDKMKEPVPVHLAQAKCYAYMYLNTVAEGKELQGAGVKMTYVNMDDDSVRNFDSLYSRPELDTWFTDLVSQYRKWADLRIEWNEKRTASIRQTNFPFEYRAGQKNLAVSVYQTILEEKKLYLEAPTGCGKTLSVLFPSVKAAGEKKADRIFYLTAKTITRTAPEEAFDIMRGQGLKFKTVTLTAKEKICFLEKTDCNPIGCLYAKGHFDRINDALYALVSENESLSREKILEYAAKYKVCPFELSLDASLFADGVIGDYNYLFDPHVRLKRFFESGSSEKYLFLVDEAHNLPSRARSMYSASVCDKDLKELKNMIKASLGGQTKSIFLVKEYAGKISSRAQSVIRALNKVKDSYGANTVIAGFEEDWYKYETGIEDLIRNMERLHSTLSDYMEEREKPGDIQWALRDKILEIYFGISDFLTVFEDLGNDYVIYDTFSLEEGFKVLLYCTDPRRKIGECLGLGRASVLFSATMLPVQYYKGLLGGQAEDYEVYAESVFDPGKRGIFIASDVTTRYKDRSEDEFFRTADHISRIVRPKKGNYMVFFPSYSYMRKVAQIYEEAFVLPGDTLIAQEESMTEADKEDFLSLFEPDAPDSEKKGEEETSEDSPVSESGSLIAFCVMGGIFSEGIDLKGDSLIGVICVGPGLPGVDLEHDILREYFDGYDHMGYEYAYMYPGMNKVLQAAGRVIRTEEDTGIVVLLDKRFLGSSYRKLFPREWTNVKITDLEHIRGDITDFWNNAPS